MSANIRTYQPKLVLIPEHESLLATYAKIYGVVERSLFSRLQAGDDINGLKYCKLFFGQ